MPDNKKFLNLGCGTKLKPKEEGWVNVDRINHNGVDRVCDITKEKLPFLDEQFDEVVADYLLCQICSQEAFMGVLNEIWRILKPNKWLKVKVPNANYPCAFQDPMDCRYFVPETFDYFNKEHYRFQAFNYGFKPWIITKIEEIEGASGKKDRLLVWMRKALRV